MARVALSRHHDGMIGVFHGSKFCGTIFPPFYAGGRDGFLASPATMASNQEVFSTENGAIHYLSATDTSL
jgi:hypothetical protein